MTVTLWRATADGEEAGRWWKATRAAAEWYRDNGTTSYGGPRLLRLQVDAIGILDCRGDFWRVVEDAGLFGPEDVEDDEPVSEVVASRRRLFLAHGFEWVVVDDRDPTDSPTWFYADDEPAGRVTYC